MESEGLKQWMKWYEQIVNEGIQNENNITNEVYAKGDNHSEVDSVQESDHNSDTKQDSRWRCSRTLNIPRKKWKVKNENNITNEVYAKGDNHSEVDSVQESDHNSDTKQDSRWRCSRTLNIPRKKWKVKV
ncbi:hypothetical protein FQA39_LY11804 [Lamprigera yunnana]|nr:hypothetical protein FQA39_LY11804 [Lamprigera yunnana]